MQGKSDTDVFVLSGGGDMGALMRSFDWSKTAVGPVAQWPQSLKTAVRIILTSRYAMFVWWGANLINLYNDPYRAFLGTKHPDALGQSAPDVWAEIWDQIGPRTEAVLLRGESTYDEALLLLMERYGYLEETYFTFSYSPLPDDEGRVGGLFCAVTEETQRIIGERRLTLLREIAAAMAEWRSSTQVCRAAAECLSGARRDLPFSLIYLLEPDGVTLKKTGQAGIDRHHGAAPDSVRLDGETQSLLPFREVMSTGEITLVDDLHSRMTDIPCGEWTQSPHRAVLVPIAAQGQSRPAGVLVAGLNPHRKFDIQFQGFVTLLANQIASGIANAVAYETERQRAEALAELDRAKTAFFSNVSHEFRTPLTLMLGPLENVLARSRERLPTEDHEQLVVARRNALRLLKLVNTLLDFSRIEAGRAQAVYEPADLSSLTSDIASVFRSVIEKAGLQYSVACEPLAEPLYVDRDLWEKIVLNLLSNAFKFTFEGEIAVRLMDKDGAVELTVRDTGVGIPEHELGRVFERFHRVENTRARTYEGTGIGLALVQELAKLHGGTVQVESTPGRGSTFTVTIPKGRAHLPVDRVQPARTPRSTALRGNVYIEESEQWLPAELSMALAGSATSVKTPLLSSVSDVTTKSRQLVLLAEDNADMREYVGRLLGELYDVHAVEDGAEALKAAHRLRPALILADVMMPHLDGFAMLRAIRNNPAINNIPVILLSARAGEESRLEGLQAGADDYLIKPFTARELLARVATHVRMANLRRGAAQREGRLRAQAELERRRLHELLSQAPAAIGLTSGPEHRWTFVNEYLVRVSGRESARDFLGKTVRESFPEIADQGFFELLDHVYETGQPFVGREMRIRITPRDGSASREAYFDFVYQPSRDPEGKTEGVLVHAVDVSDKIKARRAIEISEERLRLALAAAQMGTWEWDPAQNTRTLSSEMYRLLGIDESDPHQAEVWGSRVDPADWERVQEQMRSGYETGSLDFEYRYHHPQRGLRWLHCKGRRFPQESRLLGVLLDVTERKQAEETRHRLAAIVECSDDAIVSKDLNGIVNSWNAGAENMFGYKAEEMIGTSITRIIPPELHDDEREILDTIARGKRIVHFETVRLTKSGERIDVALTVSPVKDESGRIIGAAKIARDITGRKKAEEALRTSQRLASVGRVAATVAHEINNPLEAVTNLIYLAKHDSKNPTVVKYLADAEEELARVSLLTRQTLGFYRDMRGPVPTDIAALVQPLVAVFSSRARSKDVHIRLEIEQVPEITAVPGEARQLLANLLGNSIDAVERGGLVLIRVSPGVDWKEDHRAGVRITVADSGPGISPAIRSNLFEPFFTTKEEVGTGLGLWVCKSIVEKHGGRIRLRSNATPGRSWTVFSVFLPLQPHAAAVAKELTRAS